MKTNDKGISKLMKRIKEKNQEELEAFTRRVEQCYQRIKMVEDEKKMEESAKLEKQLVIYFPMETALIIELGRDMKQVDAAAYAASVCYNFEDTLKLSDWMS